MPLAVDGIIASVLSNVEEVFVLLTVDRVLSSVLLSINSEVVSVLLSIFRAAAAVLFSVVGEAAAVLSFDDVSAGAKLLSVDKVAVSS